MDAPLTPEQQKDYDRWIDSFCRMAQCWEPTQEMKEKALLAARYKSEEDGK